MKYLLIAIMFWAGSAGAQTVGHLMDSAEASKIKWATMPSKGFIQPIGRDTIKFKSYAEQQAFYRNYGHMIGGFDSSMLCKHIYVAVEPAEVKIQPFKPTYTLANIPLGITGKHEGQDIVCVKCFHVRKQIFDYGVGDDPNVVPPKDK